MSQKDHAIPCLCFDSRVFEGCGRLDALNEFSNGLYRYAKPEDVESALRFTLRAWNVGAIAAACFEYEPMRVMTPAKIDPSFEELVLLRAVKSGRLRVRCGDQTEVFGPGSIFLMNSRNHLDLLDDGASLAFRLPYSLVGYDPYRHGSLVSLTTTSWLGRMLELSMEVLFEKLPSLPMQEVEQIVPQIAGHVRAILEDKMQLEPNIHEFNEARSLAMRHFISANLYRQDLGIDLLMREFHASRSTVYRAFDDLGGVAGYIRDRRLAEVYSALQAASPTRGAVRQIAEQHGFFASKTFFRAFRARYGVRPSDVIGLAPEPVAVGHKQMGCPSLAEFWAA